MIRRWVAFLPIAACAALFALQAGSGQTPLPASPAQKTRMTNMSGATPLYFIANEGQMSAKALYCARTPGYTLWLTRDGLVFDRVEDMEKGEPLRSFSKMTFIGANRNMEISAADPTDYRVSYFIGRDEADWRTGVSTSKAVLYKSVYDGIDLKVYGTEKQVEYDWIVAPGADPAKIRFAYSGANAAKLNADGDLVVEASAGQILQRKPVSHQTIDGRKVAVASAFRALPDGSFGFAIGAYDLRHALAIDPLVLAYGTYLGGSEDDLYVNVFVDKNGGIYACGTTESGNFPPEIGTQSRKDFYVTKISADGQSLIYTAFFPVGFPYFYWWYTPKIFVDAKGFAYFAGSTFSSAFPVKNAFQNTLGGQVDGFVLKLSRDGQSLIFSSFIGGGKEEHCTGLFADGTGATYIGGTTNSRDFPRKRAFQPAFGGFVDSWVAKVSPQGTDLVYSTYLGGAGVDYVYDLVGDADGAAVVVGRTTSRNFPRKSAVQRTYAGGTSDGFVTKLTPAGNALAFSTYLGGSRDDAVMAVEADGTGAVYVVGNTNGTFPVKNAFQNKRSGSMDGFVAKFDSKGKSLVYSSFVGGSAHDQANAIAVGEDGTAYVVGSTMSANFPIKSPYQSVRGGSLDAFLTIVDPSGAKTVLSTFLGGNYKDAALGVALDAKDGVYIAGATNSTDFPVRDAYQSALAGKFDAFIVKFTQGDAVRVKSAL